MPPSKLYCILAPVGLVTVSTALPKPKLQSTLTAGAAGLGGRLFTKKPEVGKDVQVLAFVTVKEKKVPGVKPLIVTLEVLPVVPKPAGVLVSVQFPLGKPVNCTLPVGTVHVGCEAVPKSGVVGKAFTVNDLVLEQPVAVSVNVKVTIPALTPVTTPALVTVAMDVPLLHQVPPVAGVTLAVEPTHTLVAPPKVGLAGMALIATEIVAETQIP